MTELKVTPPSNGASPVPPFSTLKWLGQMRDGFLVAGAVLYGIGYAVWSYNARRNGLGQLPALDLQYVVAGVVPVLIGMIAWLGLASGHRIGAWLKGQIEAQRLSPRMLRVAYCVLAIPIGVLVLAIQFGWLHGSRGRWVALAYVAPFVAAIVYSQLLLFPIVFPNAFAPRHVTALERIHRVHPEQLNLTRSERFDLWLRRFRVSPKFMVAWGHTVWALVFCVSAMFAYLEAYPRLPQILGGPEPRCAYVDLLAGQISAESRAIFLPAGAAIAVSAEEPVRSRRLQVYFSGSDYLLVRPTAQVADAKKTRAAEPVYMLRNEVIRVVQWCDQ